MDAETQEKSQYFKDNSLEVRAKNFKDIENQYSIEERNVIFIKDNNDEYTDLCFILSNSEVKNLNPQNSLTLFNDIITNSKFGLTWYFSLVSVDTFIPLKEHFILNSDENSNHFPCSFKWRLNLVHNNKTLKSIEIDYSNLEYMKKKILTFSTSKIEWFDDKQLHKLYSIAYLLKYGWLKDENINPKTQIKFRYAVAFSHYLETINPLFDKEIYKNNYVLNDSMILQKFISIIENFNERNKLLSFTNDFEAFFKEHSVEEVAIAVVDNFTENKEIFRRLSSKMWTYLNLFIFSPSKTKYGEQIYWYSSTKMTFNMTDIDYETVLNHVDGDVFWKSILSERQNILNDYGKVFSGTDVPISNKKLQDGLKTIKTESSASKLEEEFYKVIDDAVLNRESIIPPKAIFEMNFGPFNNIEVNELDTQIIFILRNSTNNFCRVVIEPSQKRFYLRRIVDASPFEESDERHNQIVFSILLVLASIIRDCWVIENKESLFGTKVIKRKIGNKVEKEERIVYLPKVRYLKNPNFEKLESELNYTSRRKHYVAGHLRKSDNISEFQKKLARDYGFAVKEGYTFVRPHERGDVEVKLKYRSKSALDCLYEVIPNNKVQNYPDWLKFEKDMKRLFRNSHFEVENSSASGYGDGGIDIIIRSKADPSKVWFVQCKCYSNAVGPAVMRELKGSIALYCPEANGICVTVSNFSNQAKEAAEDPRFNFFLIDKFNLQKYLEKPFSLKKDLESFYS